MCIVNYEEKQKSRGSEHLSLIADHKKRIEVELRNLCLELIEIIEDKLLISGAVDKEVFYLKMKGDYYRYMAEVGEAEEIQKRFGAYSQASEAAKSLRSDFDPGPHQRQFDFMEH